MNLQFVKCLFMFEKTPTEEGQTLQNLYNCRKYSFFFKEVASLILLYFAFTDLCINNSNGIIPSTPYWQLLTTLNTPQCSSHSCLALYAIAIYFCLCRSTPAKACGLRLLQMTRLRLRRLLFTAFSARTKLMRWFYMRIFLQILIVCTTCKIGFFFALMTIPLFWLKKKLVQYTVHTLMPGGGKIAKQIKSNLPICFT